MAKREGMAQGDVAIIRLREAIRRPVRIVEACGLSSQGIISRYAINTKFTASYHATISTITWPKTSFVSSRQLALE